jgi:hypothetical protein
MWLGDVPFDKPIIPRRSFFSKGHFLALTGMFNSAPPRESNTLLFQSKTNSHVKSRKELLRIQVQYSLIGLLYQSLGVLLHRFLSTRVQLYKQSDAETGNKTDAEQ